MQTFTRPVVSEPGAGRMVYGFGPHQIRMTAEETGGAWGLIELDMPAGEGPPLHVHEREDEFFRVLSGRFLFVCGGSETVLEAGGCILLPRGVPHRFQNVGAEVGRLMVAVTPGGFEGFFAETDGVGLAEADAIGLTYGLRFLPALASLAA